MCNTLREYSADIKERISVMSEKRNGFKSPDLSKLQLVVIDEKTRIYVDIKEDPEKAKKNYLERLENKRP